MQNDICKKLDRIIELLETRIEPKTEDYDPEKHGDLKNYIRQRQMEHGIFISDEKAKHLAKVVDEMREICNDPLGLRR